MPPEPFPWDRKDFFKERKHERSSESIGGSVSRWRETPHHGSSSSREFARLGSAEFRSRPPGHGKQGGWHLLSEESSHRIMPSRSSEKFQDEESNRPSGYRSDGKHCRNSRENRAFFSQKDSKGRSWENSTSSNGPGRPHDVNDQRSVDEMPTRDSLPYSNSVNTCDNDHYKDEHDKNGGGVNGMGTGQRCERENPMGAIDWKPMKWTRSGSLSSRGSGFSHSSSSKSIGVDSSEAKAETALHSPTGDTLACVTSAAPSEEMGSRKKPRLGWGEGLAKFEKKKVDGPEDNTTKNGTTSSCGTEPLHSFVSSLADKSPRVAGLSECASPATPSSVACSSSPGTEDKPFFKAVSIDNDITNLSGSSNMVSRNHLEGLVFNLENFELTPVANLSSLLGELLHSDDPSYVDSSFVRSTAMSKLLLWKADVAKELETTESEIDLLESELKSLMSESGNSHPCPGSASSLPDECQANVSQDVIVEKLENRLVALEDEHDEVKGNDIDRPGTVVSKLVEPLSSEKDVSPGTTKHGECNGDSDANRYRNPEVESASGVVTSTMASDNSALVSTVSSLHCDTEDTLFNSIVACNKDTAKKASQVFSKLLPRDPCHTDISTATSASCWQNSPLIKEKFAARKRFLRFKERVITLKFRAFQHLWKEDLHLLSVRKYREKSQKKFEICSRTARSGYQKNRSSIRSRFSFPGGNLSVVPTTEIINFTSKLLSDSQVKIMRNTLKMPSLILDRKERTSSRFISSNGLVEDPCAAEKEKATINPWTPAEKGIFMDKLTLLGKDFTKIASFLDHKTTADCVEFYYKNHKSDSFEKTKKPEFAKQGKQYYTGSYLVTSGKRWDREINAASLDILGAASEIAAKADNYLEIQQKGTVRFLEASKNYDAEGDNGILERSSSVDIFGDERETVAADVLAGICGSLSSEAMSSCITSSFDPGQKVGSSRGRPLTPEVTQSVDDETCSDESCGEMNSPDWTDEEKSVFIQAVSSYGKDFVMISRCVRTRSTDQCKVFFSKARKCLGLDMVHSGPGNTGPPVNDDVNGDGSPSSVVCSDKSGSKMDEDLPCCDMNVSHVQCDPVGDMILKTGLNRSDDNNGTEQQDCKDHPKLAGPGNTGPLVNDDVNGDGSPSSVVCSGKSGSKMDEDLPCCDMNVSHVQCDPVGDMISKTGLNRSEDNNGTEQQDCKDHPTLVSENLVTDDHQMEVSLDQGLDDDQNMGNGCDNNSMLTEPHESVALPSDKEAGCGEVSLEESLSIKVENANCLSTSGAGTESKDVDEISGGLRTEPDEPALLPENSLHGKQDEIIDDGTCGHSGLNSINLDSSVISGSSFELAADKVISSGFGDYPKFQPQIDLELDPLEKPSDSVHQDSAATQCEKILYQDTSPTLDLEKIGDERWQKSGTVNDCHRHLSGHSDPVESSQVLRGYPLQVSMKKEVHGDISCNKSASLRGNLLDRNFHSDQYLSQDCYLKRCSEARSSVAELSLMSQDQTTDQQKSHARSSSDVEKSGRNVKLFGQILTHPSSQQKSNPGVHENEEKGVPHPKLSSKSFNLKFTNGQSLDGNSVTSKLDPNNYVGIENLPMRSYGFWDGHRIQIPSLPESAILLAKYPAAFSNYQTPSVVPSVVKSNERSLNGATVFPTREISSSNGVAENHQLYRSQDCTKMPSFALDTKQRQDIFSEIQRRNGFEAVSSIQQQGRGMVGINVVGRGGILCTGVSDPVAAIKMHYAKTEQYSAQPGSIIREEECWRGKGDIGR